MEPISFTRGLPWSGVRPAVIFESYEAGFASYLNARIGVLAALTVVSSLLVLFLIPLLLRASVFTPLRVLSRGMRQVEEGNLGVAVRVQSRDEIGSLASSFNRMVGGLRERFELTKYVSGGTIDALKTSQEPRRVVRTLLFTDVRGFTSYTEQRKPEQVVEVLNRLLERQSEVIQRHGGDIDKFAGDEILAVFSGDTAECSACAAALGIVQLFARNAVEFERLTVGAGIATGSVIQGMIGSIRRADFTVIGDSVNLAEPAMQPRHGHADRRGRHDHEGGRARLPVQGTVQRQRQGEKQVSAGLAPERPDRPRRDEWRLFMTERASGTASVRCYGLER